MEFDFNVNKILPKKINRITETLVPQGFDGPYRHLVSCQMMVTKILDAMGLASSKAQGLNNAVTSARKLRDTNHIVYLLVDAEGNKGMGTVVGLLKTGSKNLFLFDENGAHHVVQPRCVLDFYIHELHQRTGLGNMLYQHMLVAEMVKPVKLAIDRPSDKFLAFLRKYHGLTDILPQNNNFVVFRGFFDDVAENQDARSNRCDLSLRSTTHAGMSNNNNNTGANKANSSPNQMPPHTDVPRNSVGRYAAARPPCSMASIIHNTAVIRAKSAERTGENKHISVAATPTSASIARLERPRSLSLYSEEEQKQRTSEMSTVPTPAAVPEQKSAAPFIVPIAVDRPSTPASSSMERTSERTAEKVVERTAERTTERTAEKSVKNPSPSCAQEVTSGNQHTHLDLKFYHSPLW